MYWGAIGLVLVTLFCSIRLRDSRLGRADRDPRGRDGGSGDGHPAHAHEDVVLCVRSVLRWRRRGVVRVLPAGVFPDTFNFNVSVFILCMVILGGMGNVWGVIAGAAFLAYLNTEGLAEFGGWMNENLLRCGGGRRPAR